MKSKKLISLLSAVAVASSAFAAFAITSNAAATPVVTIDGTTADGWSTSGAVPTVKTDEGSTDSYLELTGNGTSATYDFSGLNLGGSYVIDMDTTITPSTGQGRLARYTQVAFLGETAGVGLQDPQNYGNPYAETVTEKYPPYLADGSANHWNDDTSSNSQGQGMVSNIGLTITSRVELLNKWIINYNGQEAPSLDDGDVQTNANEWVRIRAVVENGKAKVTAKTTQATLLDGVEFDADATDITNLWVNLPKYDTNFVVYEDNDTTKNPIITPSAPIVQLDNIKIYKGTDVPALTTDGLRGAAAVVTPPPAPEKVAGIAPDFSAPERITKYEEGVEVIKIDFESDAVGKLRQSDNSGAADYVAATAAPVGDGKASVQVSDRKDGAPNTYASIVKVDEGTNALKMVGGQFGSAARGARFFFTPNIEAADGETAIMAFAVYLSKETTDGKARIWLVDNGEGGTGATPDGTTINGSALIDTSATCPAYYKNFLACITTEDEAEGFAQSGDDNNCIKVEPDKWHTVVLAVTPGNKFRIWVDKEYKENDQLSPTYDRSKVSTEGSLAYMPTRLPSIMIDNCGSNSPAYSVDLVDNVIAYKTAQSVSELANLLPVVEEGEAPEEPTAAPATPTPKPTMQPAVTGITINPVAVGDAKVTLTGAEGKTAKLIHASYDANGVLTKVELKDAAAEVAITAAEAGDKIMVWNDVSNTGLNPAADAVTVAAE